ncbi:hypothetical protein HDU93_000374 [Gonapodya sp. JEL0774]|nr:hypothetical protein HDU93_000374 [Gonapodya sp. JEL0774]
MTSSGGPPSAGIGPTGPVDSPRAPLIGTPERVAEILRELGLRYLPHESGYLGLIGSSQQTVPALGFEFSPSRSDRRLAIQSQVYYMLTRQYPINFLHHLQPDDTHILIEGGPVMYHVFHPDGTAERHILGHLLSLGQRPVVAVPAGCWKALRLHEDSEYALMANVLTPEFTPDRVSIGEEQQWVDKYTGSAEWATKEFLMELIGPNWKQTPS